jgi:hypothetical protein
MNKKLFKLLLVVLIGTVSLSAFAQQDHAASGGKNLLKVSLTSLPLNTYSFTYERAIARKISLGLGVRYMPEGSVPMLNQIEKLVDDQETFDELKGLNIGNTAFTPEIKFYFGKDVFRGFYLSPFVRIAKYTANLPAFTYEYDHPVNGPTEEKMPLNGELKTFTGGLLIGAQWKLSKLIYLDWSILGPQYGTSKGFLKGNKNLSPEEQDGLREELEDLDIPMVESTTTVNSQGARLDFDGPWAGVRASIGLGIRF